MLLLYTLLKKDIRDVTAQPTYKVFAVVSEHYTDDKYNHLVKCDKSLDVKSCKFTGEIRELIGVDGL